MGEQISVPSGDGATTQWNKVPGFAPNWYSLVNEDWGSPYTGERWAETINAQNQITTYPANGPAAMATVHTMHIDLYIKTVDVAQLPGLFIMLYIGAAFHAFSQWTVDTGGVYKKLRFTLTGLSLTKAQYNQIEVHIVTTAGSGAYPTPEQIE
jgi:hypothetical protein